LFSANNLYGGAQSELLPIGEYSWLDAASINALDIETIPADGDYGYALEVDLTYPEHLHASHNSFPLAPEHMCVNLNDLSPYARGK
jgi:hypothetical protein